MIDHDRTSIIATLEKVFAQLEASVDSMGDRREKEIAGSAVHKSWKLVGEAIDHLRSIRGASESIVDRAEAGAFDKADDLTSIRGISTAFAEHLASLGVTRYAEIASWRADDVRRVAQALKLPSEISSQNWIEQAALLEGRKKLENETMKLPKPVVALAAGETAPAKQAVDPAGPDVVSQIDLPEILEAMRNDERPQEEPLPPLEAKPASHQPSRPADAEVEPLAAAIDGRQADAAHAESVGAWPTRPNSQGRVPTVTASSHVSTDANERVRRLEQERQNRARKLGRVGELPGEAEEAAVTFVIREEAQVPLPPAVLSTPSRGSTLLRRTRIAGEAAEEEAYVANRCSAEEAEVVVIKPVVQNRYGQAATSEAGPVRRLLKALRGG